MSGWMRERAARIRESWRAQIGRQGLRRLNSSGGPGLRAVGYHGLSNLLERERWLGYNAGVGVDFK